MLLSSLRAAPAPTHNAVDGGNKRKNDDFLAESCTTRPLFYSPGQVMDLEREKSARVTWHIFFSQAKTGGRELFGLLREPTIELPRLTKGGGFGK